MDQICTSLKDKTKGLYDILFIAQAYSFIMFMVSFLLIGCLRPKKKGFEEKKPNKDKLKKLTKEEIYKNEAQLGKFN